MFSAKRDACQRLVDIVYRARDDFLDADLTEVDLTGIWLKGMQWTASTRWPAAWEEEIQQNSEEIALGIWEVRRGNTREKALV